MEIIMRNLAQRQNGPKGPDDFLNCTLARRNLPLKTGLCVKCHSIFYKFKDGPFCSNKCSQFKHGLNTNGYVAIGRRKNGARVYEHRSIMKAPKGYIVHHKNGIKTDNRPENLGVMTQKEHLKHHAPHIARWGLPISLVCLDCGASGRLRRGYCSKHYQFRRSREASVKAGQPCRGTPLKRERPSGQTDVPYLPPTRSV